MAEFDNSLVNGESLRQILQKIKSYYQFVSEKFDKAGGAISGDVTIAGSLQLDIEDEDYESGIKAEAALNDNAGTILTLTGFANSASGGNTSYRPILRGIGTPLSQYDAATKKYVDDNSTPPTYHLVELNADGSVKTKASTLVYSTVAANLTNPKRRDVLDILWENGVGSNTYSRFHAESIGITEVNNGSVIFVATIYYIFGVMTMLFALDSNNTLTTVGTLSTQEQIVNKKQSVVANAQSTDFYPSTKAVFDEFQRKPVTVWEHTEGGTKIKAANVDISENPAWQITDLDLTPYKRVRFFVTPGVSSNNIAPAGIVELPLDALAANANTYGHYASGTVMQYLNNSNRLYTCSFCVSSDKTKAIFLRQTSLYGTAATSAVDDTRYLYKIVGYFD